MSSHDPTKDFYEKQVNAYLQNTKDLAPLNWINAFAETLPKGGRILDVGCAFGRDSKIFAEKGFKVLGIDYSSAMIKRARESVPEIEFRVEDVRTLDEQDASFDGVWMNAVLVHIEKQDIQGVFAGIRRILKRGGILCASFKVGTGEGLSKDERYEGAEKFWSYFSQIEMKNFAASAGFELVTMMKQEHPSAYIDKEMLCFIARK